MFTNSNYAINNNFLILEFNFKNIPNTKNIKNYFYQSFLKNLFL